MSDFFETDVLVIGGGPAGCACVIWLHQLGVKSMLNEALSVLGGLQRLSPYENLWIPGVRGHTGQAVAERLDSHVRALGVGVRTQAPVLRLEQTDGGFRAGTDDTVITSRFVVLATGTRPRSGPFMPSDRVAIGPGLPVEAMAVEGRRVAVLGGGDNAFDQARFIRDRGAAQVVVFSRGPVRAQKGLQALIPEVEVCVGPYVADQAAMTVNGEPFDAFAVMYGFEAVVPRGLSPEREEGYVRVDRRGETSIPGLYACGEVTNYWHPCVTTSAAHGIQVAKQISMLLETEA